MLIVNYEVVLGTYKDEKGLEITVHPCNGLAAMIYHFEENGEQYVQLVGFFADEGHAKNCLGLAKDWRGEKYSNIYKDVTELEFRSVPKEHEKAVKTLRRLFTRAGLIK